MWRGGVGLDPTRGLNMRTKSRTVAKRWVRSAAMDCRTAASMVSDAVQPTDRSDGVSRPDRAFGGTARASISNGWRPLSISNVTSPKL